jgi:high-affinity iron transporter
MQPVKLWGLVFLVLALFVTVPRAYAQPEEDFAASQIIVGTGLDLAKDSIKNNDLEQAEKFVQFSNDYYGRHLHEVRAFDGELADDIHIVLLDLYSAISDNEQSSQISSKLSSVNELLNSVDPHNDNDKTVSAKILAEADIQYQNSVQNDDESSYVIATHLIHSARDIFQNSTDIDARTGSELSSFFNDLENSVSQKKDFVSVATLIAAIQRDLLETESVTFNSDDLFERIRGLYVELGTFLDNNDYDNAEEAAIEAYLENFEYIESDLAAADPDLLHTLESSMREELRDMIKNHSPENEIKEFINLTILPDLQKAETLLSTSEKSIAVNSETEQDLKEMGSSSEDEKSGVRKNIDFIRNNLEETLAHYSRGDYDSAYASARSAYLDSYESVEIPLRQIDPDFTLEVEYQFAQLRNLINDHADYDDVKKVVIDIRRNLDESERVVTGTGEIAPTIAFSSSFAVIFREGLESVLIIGAIVSYLEASRNTKFMKYIYYGIVVAFGATAVTWIIASYIIDISGANRELVEAIAALSATAVLFYVSFWVLNKIEHKKWMEFVKAKVWQATTTGSVMVFVMLSFFTVYREGFETVLFYQAMSGFAKYMEVFVGLGFVIGLASLLALYYVMRKLGKKLPLRALFGLTMGVGAYMSIAFLGNAVRQLQIIDILPYTGLIGVVPRLDINLATMTGIYPTLETIVAQIILLGVYLVASTYVLIMRPKKEKQLASMRKSRGSPNAT